MWVDVHKKSIAACARMPGDDGKRVQEVFGTTATELLALRQWLETHRITHVAMESTGVYWKPIYYVLEEVFTCVFVNPVQPAIDGSCDTADTRRR
jgi:transposase